MKKLVITLIVLAAVVPASAETLILDQTGYFRSYYRFERDMIDAQVLQDIGNELLGTTQIRRLRSEVMNNLRNSGGDRCSKTNLPPLRRPRDAEFDPADVNWLEHVEARFLQRHSRHGKGFHPPAPEDWHSFDFDDSSWVRLRVPMQMGWIDMNMPARGIREAYNHIHTSSFRANFHIENVQRDAPLTLSMQFRGGVRVFINGHEIARSHLPEGELHTDALAKAYPMEAYVLAPEELSEEDRNNLPDRADSPREYFEALFKAHDLPISYDEAVASGAGKEPHLPREVWDRIYNARERRLENITIPANLLRQGRNVLAIELRTTPIHPVTLHDQENNRTMYDWFAHSRIKWLRLTSRSNSAVTSLRRPAGMQAWTTDLHERIYGPEYLEPGAPVGEIRITAVRNGTFGSQIIVGSDKALNGFGIQLTDLAHEDGRTRISRSQIHVFGSNARPGNTLAQLGGERGRTRTSEVEYPMIQRTYGMQPNGVNHLDELTDRLFDTVPADHAMLAWLSLRVPDDAKPGVYRGAATVSAGGVRPVRVPIEVKVIDWQAPDPADFTTFSGIGTCPHGLRNHYSRRGQPEMEWYGDRHLALIRRTYELLARIGGGDWLDIQVLDSPHEIMWIRMPDGSLTFDFTNLKRLLDVVVATVGKPKVINFNIMYPFGDRYTARVPVRNHGSDEIEWVELGPDADPDLRVAYWRQFAYALYGFMRSNGLEDRMYWGTPWDREGDPELVHLMASFVPAVHWGRKSHYFMPDKYYRATSTVYGIIYREVERYPLEPLDSMMGWSNQDFYRLANSRQYTTVHFMEGASPAFCYRIKPERAIVAGYNGYGVYDAEGSGFRMPFGAARGGIGWAIAMLFWPGQNGMNTSPRVEALIEGLQETEARIFIERALVDGLLPESMTTRAIKLLNERMNAVGHLKLHAHMRSGHLLRVHQGWRHRSEALYELAAEVAGFVGLELERPEIKLELLAGTTQDVPVRVFNRSGKIRAWQARSDNENIKLAATAGQTAATDSLRVTIDGRQSTPGQTIKGIIAVVDSDNRRTHEVTVNSRIVPPMELAGTSHLLFVKQGVQAEIDTMLVNHTNREITWRATSSIPWIALKPRDGVLAPKTSLPLRLIAIPPRAIAEGRIDAAISFTDNGGRLISAIPMTVYVEPEHPAIPEGVEPAYLVNLDNRIAHHYTLTHRHRSVTTLSDDRPRREGLTIEAVPFPPYKVSGPGGDIDEIVYDISGSGYDTFVTNINYTPRRPDLKGRSRFQIITDGQIRFDTGWITPSDNTIPVVVPNLREVRRFTLLFTRENAMANDFGTGFWVEPRFYMVAQ